MKRNELPQDKSALTDITRELHYVKDEDGKYRTGLSTGWKVKAEALDNAWEDINQKINEARTMVINREKSPVYFFMHKNLMDIKLLSQYTGICRLRIKKHLKPKGFHKLSEKKLVKYADVFNISVSELKNFNIKE